VARVLLVSNRAVAGSHDLEGAFNQNFDFGNFYYYVRVDINRSNANSTAIFYGVRVLNLAINLESRGRLGA
jgi:hypothetical protein